MRTDPPVVVWSLVRAHALLPSKRAVNCSPYSFNNSREHLRRIDLRLSFHCGQSSKKSSLGLGRNAEISLVSFMFGSGVRSPIGGHKIFPLCIAFELVNNWSKRIVDRLATPLCCDLWKIDKMVTVWLTSFPNNISNVPRNIYH